MNDWSSRKDFIANSFKSYLKFTRSVSRGSSIDRDGSDRWLYPVPSVESDLFFFWGLIVQICQCWDVAGNTVSTNFADIYDEKKDAFEDLADGLLNHTGSRIHKYSNQVGYYSRSDDLKTPLEDDLLDKQSFGGDGEKLIKTHYHFLRTLRNGFSHARFLYKKETLSVLLSGLPQLNLTLASFRPDQSGTTFEDSIKAADNSNLPSTNQSGLCGLQGPQGPGSQGPVNHSGIQTLPRTRNAGDADGGEPHEYLLVVADRSVKSQHAYSSLRVIITHQVFVRFHMFKFLVGVLDVNVGTDVDGNPLDIFHYEVGSF